MTAEHLCFLVTRKHARDGLRRKCLTIRRTRSSRFNKCKNVEILNEYAKKRVRCLKRFYRVDEGD